MKKYFPFDNARPGSLYSEIANCIKQYYPNGLSSLHDEYHLYPGIVKRNEIIAENIGPPGQKLGPQSKKWEALLKFLNKNADKPIEGTTYGFVPGFSADLILEKFENGTLSYTKRIAFAVSLLGPFFSICGIDETTIKHEDDDFQRYYPAINVVTASPYKEFENDFNGIKYSMQKYFPDYKFIPFYICMMHLDGVQTPDSIGQEETVYNALFNHSFNYYTHHKSRGDNYYGMERNPNIKITLSRPPADTD